MNQKRLCRSCVLPLAICALVLLMPAILLAGPLVAHPGATHAATIPPFVVHLAPGPPAPLIPAGAPVGPLLYGDVLPSLGEPHHLEIELNNPAAIPASFNVAITYPGGAFPLTGISLAPGASVYWDLHYGDFPPEIAPVGYYSFFATNPAGVSPLLTVTASVIEYPIPVFFLPVGGGLPVFAPALGGAVLPAPLIGVAPVLITVVPEPTSLGLAGIWLMAFAVMKRRHKAAA